MATCAETDPQSVEDEIFMTQTIGSQVNLVTDDLRQDLFRSRHI